MPLSEHRKRTIILTAQMSKKQGFTASDYGNAVSLWPLAIILKINGLNYLYNAAIDSKKFPIVWELYKV